MTNREVFDLVNAWHALAPGEPTAYVWRVREQVAVNALLAWQPMTCEQWQDEQTERHDHASEREAAALVDVRAAANADYDMQTDIGG